MEGSLNSTDACWIMISTHNSWWPHPRDHVVCGDCQDAAECGPGLVCTVGSMTRQFGPDSILSEELPCFETLGLYEELMSDSVCQLLPNDNEVDSMSLRQPCKFHTYVVTGKNIVISQVVDI